jgi:hypothetical protein
MNDIHRRLSPTPPTRRELPPGKAFVIQLHAGSGARSQPVSGRVEHIASGRIAHFHSVDELLEFIADALGSAAEARTEKCHGKEKENE